MEKESKSNSNKIIVIILLLILLAVSAPYISSFSDGFKSGYNRATAQAGKPQEAIGETSKKQVLNDATFNDLRKFLSEGYMCQKSGKKYSEDDLRAIYLTLSTSISDSGRTFSENDANLIVSMQDSYLNSIKTNDKEEQEITNSVIDGICEESYIKFKKLTHK